MLETSNLSSKRTSSLYPLRDIKNKPAKSRENITGRADIPGILIKRETTNISKVNSRRPKVHIIPVLPVLYLLIYSSIGQFYLGFVNKTKSYFPSPSAIFRSLARRGTLFCPPSLPWLFIYATKLPAGRLRIFSCWSILPARRSR